MANQATIFFILGLWFFHELTATEPKCLSVNWFNQNIKIDSKTLLVEGFQSKSYRAQLKERSSGWTDVVVQAMGRMKDDPKTKKINIEAVWGAINRMSNWGNRYQTVVPFYKQCIKFSPENYMVVFERFGDFLQTPEVLERMTQKRALSFRIKSYIELLSQVDRMHQKKIIHCDLQPNNILVKGGEEFRIVGFGMVSTEQCQVGARFFTAPEIYDLSKLASKLASKADVYSLGITLLLIEEYKQYKSMTNPTKPTEPNSRGSRDHLVIIERIENLESAKKTYFEKENENAFENYLSEKKGLMSELDQKKIPKFKAAYDALLSHWESLMDIVKGMIDDEYNNRMSIKQAINRLEILRFKTKDDHKKFEPKIQMDVFRPDKLTVSPAKIRPKDKKNPKPNPKEYMRDGDYVFDQTRDGKNRQHPIRDSLDSSELSFDSQDFSDGEDLDSSDDFRLRI